VANLRQRLQAQEKLNEELRSKHHSLLQQQGPSGRGSVGSGGNNVGTGSRDAGRVKELEKEIGQIRTNLQFRENDNQKQTR